MLHRRAFVLTTFAMGVLLPFPGLADPAAEATAALSAMHGDLVAIIADEGKDPARQRALVEHFLTSHLDLTRMAAEALGTHFELMDKRQFAEFSREYSHFLTYIYLREISWVRQDGGEFKIVSAEFDPESGAVRLKTRAAMRPSLANAPAARERWRQRVTFEGSYLMKEQGDEWKITAIRFNGVDLNRVFGAQFASILERRSPELLVEELRRRNAENAKQNPFEKK